MGVADTIADFVKRESGVFYMQEYYYYRVVDVKGYEKVEELQASGKNVFFDVGGNVLQLGELLDTVKRFDVVYVESIVEAFNDIDLFLEAMEKFLAIGVSLVDLSSSNKGSKEFIMKQIISLKNRRNSLENNRRSALGRKRVDYPVNFIDGYVSFVAKEKQPKVIAKELGVALSTFYRLVREFENVK